MSWLWLGFLSANILNICKQIWSIQGFMWGCSKMMLSFLYWHLLHSSLSWGIKSQGNSTTGKKILCKWDDSRGGDSLWLSWMLSWGTSECLPTIEMVQLFPFPLESAASSFLRLDNCKWCKNIAFWQLLCSVFQFLDTWSWSDWFLESWQNCLIY